MPPVGEAWDVPRTDAGREKLAALITEYRASGNQRELGICLSRMGYVVKHIGTGDEEGAFAASARYGEEAVRILRVVDDRKELCRALRTAAVPWVDGVDHASLLSEALRIAQEIGDKEEEGWTIYRMTLADGVDGYTVEQALECFEACGSLEGRATCLVTIGFNSRPRRPELIVEAVSIYEKLGDHIEAERARLMADVSRQSE